MRSTTRYGVCSTFPTLFVSPDSAGGGLGRARVVSLAGCCFRFFVKILVKIKHSGIHGFWVHRSQITVVWYGMVWCGVVWCGMVWYGMVWYGMVWYDIVIWYGMVWYGMVWYGMA